MPKITGTILAILLTTLLCTACGKEEENITEQNPGKIDEITQTTANAIVKKIRTPINKARLTQDLGDKRMEEMEKALQNQ